MGCGVHCMGCRRFFPVIVVLAGQQPWDSIHIKSLDVQAVGMCIHACISCHALMHHGSCWFQPAVPTTARHSSARDWLATSPQGKMPVWLLGWKQHAAGLLAMQAHRAWLCCSVSTSAVHPWSRECVCVHAQSPSLHAAARVQCGHVVTRSAVHCPCTASAPAAPS